MNFTIDQAQCQVCRRIIKAGERVYLLDLSVVEIQRTEAFGSDTDYETVVGAQTPADLCSKTCVRKRLVELE